MDKNNYRESSIESASHNEVQADELLNDDDYSSSPNESLENVYFQTPTLTWDFVETFHQPENSRSGNGMISR